MAECFVTLDKYKADLARYVARDKLIIERLEQFLNQMDSDKACRQCMNGGTWRVRFEMALQMLRQPMDTWFTEDEWKNPFRQSESVHPSKSKFTSVADGVQGYFEFEDER